jgi:hypothetical protein
MIPAPSPEALELRAATALQMDGDERRAHATQRPLPDHPTAFPDPTSFPSAAGLARSTDPWRATLLAEAWVTARRRRALHALHHDLDRVTVRLRDDDPGVPWKSIPTVLTTEPHATRREAIREAADGIVHDTVAPARAVVDALREGFDALEPELREALAFGDDAHDDLLDATDDLLRELDHWIARALGLDGNRLTWADRLHSLAGPATLTAIPPATWPSLGARTWHRVGLDRALRGIVDDLLPAAVDARGVVVIPTVPGERSVVAGRPTRAGVGAAEILGAMAEAASQTLGRGPFPALRRGRDRALDGLANALGRRLLLERHWLHREAGLDSAPRERVMLETLHAEVLRVRLDAALARFAAHVLARRADAGLRFHTEVTRAWRVAPPPSWAPWVAASLFDGHGVWTARPAGRVLGARLEPLVVEALRERYDEDWFRNPKAGSGLEALFDEVRAVGLRNWGTSHGRATDVRATVRRFDEAMRDARRGVPRR